MSVRSDHLIRTACLCLVLVPTQFFFALAARGQDAPPAENAPAAAAAPAAGSSEGSPLYNSPFNGPGSYQETPFSVVPPTDSSDLGAPLYQVPQSSAFRGYGGTATTLTPINADPFAGNVGLDANQYPKMGEAQGSVSIYSQSDAGIPFVYRAFPPDDADLKAGPFYLKFESLEADMYYSDNYNETATDRRSEVLAILSLNMTLMAQITEGLEISVNGTLIYLPLQNTVGVTSNSFYGNFPLLLPIPTFLSAVNYDTLIGGWYVRFEDQISAQPATYSDSTQYTYNLFSGSVLDQSNGKYVFRSGHVDLRSNQSGSNSQEDNFFVYSNIVSAETSHYYPDDVLVSARAYRQDLWYNQETRGLPTSRDDFLIQAQSIRENMRFKPYVSFEVEHTSDVPGVYEIGQAGFTGPITDQLFLAAGAGYYLSNTGNQGFLYDLTLTHQAGPDTSEVLQVARSLNDFDDEVDTTEYYRITQVLGPTLNVSAFADHTEYEEFSGDLSNDNQEDAGVLLACDLGPLTSLRIAGLYTHQHFNDNSISDTWTGRIDLYRHISDTLFFRAIYQYQRYIEGQASNGSYYENTVYLSLEKIFP